MRLFDKREWYFFFQKISLGERERYFIYVLIGILVSVEAIHQSGWFKAEPDVFDYRHLDSLIAQRTALMQAEYDSVIKLQYKPDSTFIAEVNEIKEAQKQKKSSSKKKSPHKTPQKININTATLSEWIQVPGIGEKTAQTILDFRLKEGPFMSIEDLTKVKGIGPKKLEKLREFLTVE